MARAQTAAYSVGALLPEIVHELTQDQINAYAAASGDHNPLHLDPEFAATTRFGGTIAHGMLVLAFISEMLTTAFGPAWANTGRLKVRFRDAARPGDIAATRGRITRVSGSHLTCEIECVNQHGTVLINGDAEVTLP